MHAYLYIMLSFLVNVLYRLKIDTRSFDPMDYECIDENTECWVVEEAPEGELEEEEFENMLDGEEREPGSQPRGFIFTYLINKCYHFLS